MKKLLALVLALVMTLGLATVGASATTFTDDADIDHQEAVEVMNSLNIINGMGDGKFDPNGNVTRAQMAKMVTIALLGDVEVSAFTGTATDLKDVGGHWAEGYIKYCYSQGIISGRGNGIFDPNANVTTAEASKMLLVALGYNSDVRKYTGDQWAINVARDAQMKGMYKDIANLTSNKAMDRDDAAQLIYNTLNAERVIAVEGYNSDGVFTTQYRAPQGTESKTLLEETFDAKVYIGNFAQNDKTDDSLKEGMIKLSNGHLDSATSGVGTPEFYSDLDISYIGEEVKVIFEDAKNGRSDQPDKEDTIYGVYVTGNTKVINTTRDKVKDALSDGKLEVDGTKYKFNAVDVTVNYGAYTAASIGVTTAWTQLSAKTGDAVKFILDDDGKITKAYVTQSFLGSVSAVNSEKITVVGLGTVKIADNEVYSGAAKDDIVVYTKLYDSTTADAYCIVEKAPVVQGTVKGYTAKVAGTSTSKVVLDGTSYTIYGEAAMPTAVIDDNAGVAYFDNGDIDETYNLYMLNGFVARAEKTSTSMNDYAVVLDRNDGILGSTFSAPKAELMLADGSKVNVTLHKDSVIYKDANRALTTAVTSTDKMSDTNVLDKYTIVKYAKVSDDVYKVEEVGTWLNTGANVQIYEKDTKVFATHASGVGSGSLTASGATLFAYNDTTDTVQVYNLRDMNDITNKDGVGANLTGINMDFAYVAKDSKIIVAFAFLANRPSGSTANTFYGVVASADGVEKIDDEYYNKYTVVNDKESKTVYVSGGTLAKKNLVSFDVAADNIYANTEITVYDGDTGNWTNGEHAAYVKEYNEADKTLTAWTAITGSAAAGFAGSAPETKALDDKCQIVYINADDTKAGDEVGVNAFDGVTGYRNALVVVESDKIVAIFVESSLEADILGYSGYNITIDGTVWGTYAVGATVDWSDLYSDLPAAYDLATAVTIGGNDWSDESTYAPGADFAMPAANIVIIGEYAVTGTHITSAAVVAKATSGNTTNTYAVTVATAPAHYGDDVVLTVSKGAGSTETDGTITVTVTGDDSHDTIATGTVTVGAGGEIVTTGDADKVTFTMPGEDVTVTLEYTPA